MKKYVHFLSNIFLSFCTFLFSTSLTFAGCCHYPMFPPIPIFPCISSEPCKALKDGFYVGLGVGYDSYRIHESLNLLENVIQRDFVNPALYAGGWLGSLFGGYGQYYCRFYIGLEVFADYSGANTSYRKLPVNTIYDVNIDVRSSYGLSILPGVKLNKYTLLYARIGYIRTTFKSTERVVNPLLGFNINDPTTKYCNGLQFGLGIESAIFHHLCDCCGVKFCEHFANNLSLRADYSYSVYNAWTSTTVNTSFNPSNNQFVLSLIYHFA